MKITFPDKSRLHKMLLLHEYVTKDAVVNFVLSTKIRNFILLKNCATKGKRVICLDSCFAKFRLI